MVISIVAAAIFFVAAVLSIQGKAQVEAEAEAIQTQEVQQRVTISPTPIVTTTAQPATEAEQESTYTSLIKSRDWSGEDSEILLKIAMAEAEGEDTEGKALVMLVVLNRVWSDDFPDSIEDVVFQTGQFSPVAEGGRYYTTVPDEDCYKALGMVMGGWDESYGALYFESCENSSWHSENLEFVFQHGGHRFYK